MADLTWQDREVLRQLTRLEGAQELDPRDNMGINSARSVLAEVKAYTGSLDENVSTLIDQLGEALRLEDEHWRGRCWLIAHEAKRQLLVGGQAVRA